MYPELFEKAGLSIWRECHNLNFILIRKFWKCDRNVTAEIYTEINSGYQKDYSAIRKDFFPAAGEKQGR